MIKATIYFWPKDSTIIIARFIEYFQEQVYINDIKLL